MDIPNLDTLKAGGSDKRKAQELLALFAFVKASAMNLVERSSYKSKATLKQEIQVHFHMVQKSLDTIALYAKE